MGCMPGHPILDKLLYDINKAGGWQPIIERIMNGDRMADIAATFGVSRTFMVGVLRKDPERAKLVDEARKAAAEMMAEDAVALADAIDEDRPFADRKARHQIEVRKWIAGKWNPEKYGESKAPLLQINANVQFLDALKAIEQRREARLAGDASQTALPPAHETSTADLILEGSWTEVPASTTENS